MSLPCLAHTPRTPRPWPGARGRHRRLAKGAQRSLAECCHRLVCSSPGTRHKTSTIPRRQTLHPESCAPHLPARPYRPKNPQNFPSMRQPMQMAAALPPNTLNLPFEPPSPRPTCRMLPTARTIRPLRPCHDTLPRASSPTHPENERASNSHAPHNLGPTHHKPIHANSHGRLTTVMSGPGSGVHRPLR